MYVLQTSRFSRITAYIQHLKDLVANVVRNNRFGLGGTDLNGRDLAYDGNGTDNCFGGNTGVAVTIPADGSTLAPDQTISVPVTFAPGAVNPGD